MKMQIYRLPNRGRVELLSATPQSGTQVTVRLQRGGCTDILAHQNNELHQALFEAINRMIGITFTPRRIYLTQIMSFVEEKIENIVCINLCYGEEIYIGTGTVEKPKSDRDLLFAVGEAYVECINKMLGEIPMD